MAKQKPLRNEWQKRCTKRECDTAVISRWNCKTDPKWAVERVVSKYRKTKSGKPATRFLLLRRYEYPEPLWSTVSLQSEHTTLLTAQRAAE